MPRNNRSKEWEIKPLLSGQLSWAIAAIFLLFQGEFSYFSHFY